MEPSTPDANQGSSPLSGASPNQGAIPTPGTPQPANPLQVAGPGAVVSPSVMPPQGGLSPSPVSNGSQFQPAPSAITPSGPSIGPTPPPAGANGQVVSGGFDASASSLPPAAPMSPSQMFNPSTSAGPGPVVGASEPLPPLPTTSRRSMKPFLIAVIALVVLGGASAAAYVGVIVPNKPANVLRAALVNSLQQQQVSTDGSIQASPASGGGVAYKIAFKTAGDSKAKTADAQISVTVSGITFPVEARLVNQDVYVKIGDLSTITGLIGAYSPDAATLAKSLSADVSNKWIVIDSTIINESASAKCALNTNWALSKTDVTLLETQYAKHPFTTIQSSSSDTVNGKAAEKFVLSLDDDKLSTFGDGLKDLSLIKALQKCDPSANSTNSSSSIADHDHTPLTVWVDKSSKRIVQVASNSTSQDAKKGNLTASGKFTIDYGKVSVSAPSNPEPAIQVLTDVQNSLKATNPDLLNLFTGGGDTNATPSSGGLLQ